MPFGKHANERMEDVPAQYLLWLWDNGLHEMSGNMNAKPGTYPHKQYLVARYIRENFAALEMDAKDYLVQHIPSR